MNMQQAPSATCQFYRSGRLTAVHSVGRIVLRSATDNFTQTIELSPPTIHRGATASVSVGLPVLLLARN